MITIVLVEPKNPENFGAILRVMMNFGFKNLIVINPQFSFDDEKIRRVAKHAYKLVNNVKVFEKFEDAIKGFDLIIGTTAKISKSDSNFLRSCIELKNLKEICKGNIAIVFGREDIGLLNDEVKLCDILATIPTSKEYPALNLSHAVAIFLYELSNLKIKKFRLASQKEKEVLFKYIEELLEIVKFPSSKEKRRKAIIMFKRIIGRANLTGREINTILGILRKLLKILKAKEK